MQIDRNDPASRQPTYGVCVNFKLYKHQTNINIKLDKKNGNYNMERISWQTNRAMYLRANTWKGKKKKH